MTGILYLLWESWSTAARVGAGDGNRTHLTSLEGWRITTMLRPHRLRRQATPAVGRASRASPAGPWRGGPSETLLHAARRHDRVGHPVKNLLIGGARRGPGAPALRVVPPPTEVQG